MGLEEFGGGVGEVLGGRRSFVGVEGILGGRRSFLGGGARRSVRGVGGV